MALIVAAPVMLAIGLGVAILATGDDHVASWSARLSSMADDRAVSIQRWADELSNQAATFASYPTVLHVLGGHRPPMIPFPSEGDRHAHLAGILARAATHHGHANIWVFDRSGAVVARARDGTPPAPVVRAAREAAGTGRSGIAVHSVAGGAVHVVAIARVHAGSAGVALGAVAVETRADEFLYPLLASQPVPTRTGEALLIGLEDSVIRFISPVRKLAAEPLSLAVPATPGLAGSTAVARDVHLGRFVDYAGQSVLAATRRIDGVPWGLVVKVDHSEVLAERRAEVLLLTLTVAGLLLAALGAAYGLWSHRLAQAQQKLRERDERFRWHAERAGDLIYRYRPGPEARFEYVNPAVAALLGYEPEEFYDDPGLVWRTVHPQDRPILEEAMAHPAAVDGEPLLLRWIRKDGRVLWLEQRNTVIRDETGAVVALEGIAREVTARQELERELREARDRLQLALHVARQSTFDMDFAADRVLLTNTRRNDAGLRAHNRTFTVAAALEVVHTEDRSGVERLLTDLREGAAESGEVEYRVCTAAGLRWVRTVARVVGRADDGAALRVVGLHADVTARRQAEDELRESHVRYSALHEQMLQAQKMEAVGRLAGGIAHDFNNMLTSIRGHALLARDDLPVGWPARGDLDEVVRDADRAAALTRQLLAFSRKQVLELRVFDLGEVVAGMEAMIRRLIGEDVRLVVDRRDCPCPVHADRVRMEQVIMNLAVNARDAMPRGGDLTLEVHSGDGDQGQVVLQVRDTGTGMDADTIERIFEPFFTTKAEGKGTGLGLSTVYGIVHQSGGTISVDSVVGAGTTFTMTFPRAPWPVEQEAGAGAGPDGASETISAAVSAAGAPMATASGTCTGDPVHGNGRGAGTGGTLRILVVEDESGVLALTRRVLEKHGFTVAAAASPEEALRLADEEPGGLRMLLSDIVLPGISGPALAARLAPRHPDLRVILMSGYPEAFVRGHHRVPDDALFLEKPFTPDQLLACVRDALTLRTA